MDWASYARICSSAHAGDRDRRAVQDHARDRYGLGQPHPGSARREDTVSESCVGVVFLQLPHPSKTRACGDPVVAAVGFSSQGEGARRVCLNPSFLLPFRSKFRRRRRFRGRPARSLRCSFRASSKCPARNPPRSASCSSNTSRNEAGESQSRFASQSSRVSGEICELDERNRRAGRKAAAILRESRP